MLAIPYAFRADGVLFGCFIVFLAGLTSSFGLYLQMRSAHHLPAGHATFFGVCLLTYPRLLVVFDLAIFLQCFGCCVLYLVIVGDLLPELVGIDSFGRRAAVLCSAALIVPLAYLRNLDSLRFSLMLGLGAIGYIFVLVVGHYVGFLIGGGTPQSAFPMESEQRGEVRLATPLSAQAVLQTFSIIVFAYTGHQNMFSIINESKDKSDKNILQIIGSLMGLSTALFLVVGLAGYLTFGDNVSGNVILMYDNQFLNLLGRYATIFMVIVSFPLMFHPARISANNILYYLTTSNTEETTPLIGSPKPVIVPLPTRTFLVLTTVFILTAYGIALGVSEFAIVLSLVGATGSTTISFILPGLFGYKLLGNDENANDYKQDMVLKKCSLALTIWGVFVMVLCVGATLLWGSS